MNSFRTLNVTLVIIVFLIMTFSGALSVACLALLYKLGIIPNMHVTPAVYPMVALVVSTVIGTILTMAVAYHVLRPLNELIAGTREVARGNFKVKVKGLNGKNELDELIRSFNNMTNELNGIELFRKDFINNFSHEFRTPIVAIRGFARQLQRESLTDEQRKEYTDIIISESERLTNMSSNVLLLTKLENQEIITDKERFSLDEQLRSCILLLQPHWEKKNISFQLELDPIEYYSNEVMLSHIWLNLLGNAIKFSNYSGEIIVQCCEDSSEVTVKIADEGIGMDDETRQHIFEKFYQGDLTHNTEGNGLGLSLVNRIVDLCKGRIELTSQLGKKTEFTVHLPK